MQFFCKTVKFFYFQDNTRTPDVENLPRRARFLCAGFSPIA